MTDLIMSKETVTTTFNLFPKIESLLDFDERIAVKAFINGNPTDEQQMIVLGICKAIMDTNPIGRDKNGKSMS